MDIRRLGHIASLPEIMMRIQPRSPYERAAVQEISAIQLIHITKDEPRILDVCFPIPVQIIHDQVPVDIDQNVRRFPVHVQREFALERSIAILLKFGQIVAG